MVWEKRLVLPFCCRATDKKIYGNHFYTSLVWHSSDLLQVKGELYHRVNETVDHNQANHSSDFVTKNKEKKRTNFCNQAGRGNFSSLPETHDGNLDLKQQDTTWLPIPNQWINCHARKLTPVIECGQASRTTYAKRMTCQPNKSYWWGKNLQNWDIGKQKVRGFLCL